MKLFVISCSLHFDKLHCNISVKPQQCFPVISAFSFLALITRNLFTCTIRVNFLGGQFKIKLPNTFYFLITGTGPSNFLPLHCTADPTRFTHTL